MRKHFVIVVGSLLAATPVLAQAPADSPITQPVLDIMPFDIPYGTPITLATAHKALAAAEAEAAKHNWKLVCAVAEPTGDLIAFDKMDGAQYASIQIAPEKARAAARFRRATKVFADAVNKNGTIGTLGIPGAITAEGGFPIVVGGKLVGAIGCSGAIGNQDATAAWAGVDAVK